jgi:hypothetical protein
MRTEAKLFLGLGFFMLPLGIIYAIAGGMTSGVEIAGAILMFVVAIAFTFIGVYLSFQAKHLGGLRPEDWDATPAEGQGEVGSFPVSSIYPLLGAIGVTIVAFGLVFSTILVAPGFLLIFLTVIGMARESEISELHQQPLDHAVTSGHAQDGPSFSDNVKK